jgi:hypothetical protein
LIRFAASKPRGPPLSVVLTLALSITPAAGLDPPFQLPRGHDQQAVDRVQTAAVSPIVEAALHRPERREVPRQQAPLAAGGGDMPDRISHVAKIGAARAGKQRGDQRPFLICQLA